MESTIYRGLDHPPSNIIIRMPNWLGDLVMATPILEDVRSKWPQAQITAMCQTNVAPLLYNNPHIDEIFSFKKPNGWMHRTQHLKIIEPIKAGAYDLGILLTNSFSSAYWFWRGGVKNRIGYSSNFKSLLLNEAIALPSNLDKQHLVLTYKMLLEPLGIPISNSIPHLYISAEEKMNAERILKDNGVQSNNQIIIGINPGAAYGSAKCWLPERFHQVTEKLIQRNNVVVVYFGDASGTPLVNDICMNFSSERVINLAGKTTLRELVALINCCSVFLTNDSGPMHIAAALGVKLLALFGSTDEVRTGPYPAGRIIHKHVECSPCFKRVCPIDFRCMKNITVDEVYSELEQILNKP